MNLIQVSGLYNSHPIKTKYFKNQEKAIKYLDKVLTNLNVEIEEVFNQEDTLTTFVVNNYTRFMVTKLS